MQPLLRCLDATHPRDCAVCTPAPTQSEEAAYELACPSSAKPSAEKRLRSLLAHTPEWASSEERLRLAAEVEELQPELAHSLRARLCSQLRKADLIALARSWRYRSDLWRPKRAHWALTDVAWSPTTLTAAASSTEPSSQLLPALLPAPRVQQRQPPSTTHLCRVPGCTQTVAGDRSSYARRIRLCSTHRHASELLIDGQSTSRFCQKCYRLHPTSEFQGLNRTCTRMLSRHNERRRSAYAARKSSRSPEAENAEGFSDALADALLDFPLDEANTQLDASIWSQLLPWSDSMQSTETDSAPASLHVAFKFPCDTPLDLPPSLYEAASAALGDWPLALEGAIEPGCVLLTLHTLGDAEQAARIARDARRMLAGFDVSARCSGSMVYDAAPPIAPLAASPNAPLALQPPHRPGLALRALFHGQFARLGCDGVCLAPLPATLSLPALGCEGVVLWNLVADEDCGTLRLPRAPARRAMLLIRDAAAAAEINASASRLGFDETQAASALTALGHALRPACDARLAARAVAAALRLGWHRAAMLAAERLAEGLPADDQPLLPAGHGSLLHAAVRAGDSRAATLLAATPAFGAPGRAHGATGDATPLHLAAVAQDVELLGALLGTAAAAAAWCCARDACGATPSALLRARLRDAPDARLAALDAELHASCAPGAHLARAAKEALCSSQGVFLASHQALLLPGLLRAQLPHPAFSRDAVDIAEALLLLEPPPPRSAAAWLHATADWARATAAVTWAPSPEYRLFRHSLVLSNTSLVLFQLVLTAVPNLLMLWRHPPTQPRMLHTEVRALAGTLQHKHTVRLFAAEGYYFASLLCNVAVVALILAGRRSARAHAFYVRYNSHLLAAVFFIRYILANALAVRSVCARYGDVLPCPVHVPAHLQLIQAAFTVVGGLLPLRASLLCALMGVRACMPFLPAGLYLWSGVLPYRWLSYRASNTACSWLHGSSAVSDAPGALSGSRLRTSSDES